MKSAFSNHKYFNDVLNDINRYTETDHKVFIHIGGKLTGDKHSSRVLPGYDPDVKIKLLQKLTDNNIVFVLVTQQDIDKKRIRGDSGLVYDEEVVRYADELVSKGIAVTSIILVGSADESINPNTLTQLRSKAKSKPYSIISESEISFTEKSNNIVVTSPGSDSGKADFVFRNSKRLLESKHHVRVIKIDNFPCFKLLARHPLNLAYFAAIADKYQIDFNMLENNNWELFQKDSHVISKYALLKSQYPNFESTYTDKFTKKADYITDNILDMNQVIKQSVTELQNRLVRYQREVATNNETQTTLDFVQKLITFI